MPRPDGTFFNSWERAQAHGGPWLSTSGVFWLLHAPKGKVFTVQNRKDETVTTPQRSFKTFAEAIEVAEKLWGVKAWKRDNMKAFHPSDDGTNDVPCVGYGLKVCGNLRKPGETMCGVHLNVVRRDAERKVAWRERTERWSRDRKLSEDCRKAAEPLGIPVNKGHHVSMHAEDFLALCWELTELRELREFA